MPTVICDHACINQPLGTKVEFPEQGEIANTYYTHKLSIMPITLVQSKDQ